MYGQRPQTRMSGLGGLTGGAPPPRDLLVLLAVVFVTFSLQFFATTRIVPDLLRLSPLVWQLGFLWQLVTYPAIGYGPPSLWFLLELLIAFWFGRDVFWHLGRRRFWRILGLAALAGSLVAVATALLAGAAGGGLLAPPFVLMQGQRTLLAVLVAAFATLYGRATIYLFFVLPIQARWFLPIEILFAFIGFLGTRDLAGFLGICAAVGATWWWLRSGGRRLDLRETRLRVERWWLDRRLRRLRKRRGFTVVEGEGKRGPGRGDGYLH